MSGVDRPNDKLRMHDWVTKILGREDLAPLIYNDAAIALSNGTKGILDGVVLISGTGTIAYGWDSSRGVSYRAAGWGYPGNAVLLVSWM